VLLVVSHTAATAIVALLRFLPLDDRNLIMHTLESILHQELAAQRRNVRLPPFGRRRRAYDALVEIFQDFVNNPDQDAGHGGDTVQDPETTAETTAAAALGSRADFVLERMRALTNHLSLMHLLHGEVVWRAGRALRPMNEVIPANNLLSVSELSSFPSVDVVNHGVNDDRDNNTV
jgi:hypothetical protein